MAENKTELMTLDDDVLDAVMGGMSLYEGADGMDRDSWFVRLMRRRMSNGAPVFTPPPGAQDNTNPLSTMFVGDYSARR